MVQLIRNGFSLLVLLFTLGLILCLSGCIQPPLSSPSSVFNADQAEFYNPFTNKTESLSVVNLNGSKYSFHHQDPIELLVGVRDSQGVAGVNYSLILMMNYTFDWEPRDHNLTDQLNLQIITNSSGLARVLLIYDQYTWPQTIDARDVQFQLFCLNLPNVTASSEKFTLCYFHSEISRNTTVEGGLEALDLLERSNLLEEALSLGGSDNTFSDWHNSVFFENSFHYVIINASTIEFFSSLSGSPHIEFQYQAWVFDRATINLTYSNLTHICTDLWGRWFPPINEYLPDEWLISAPPTHINVSTGWVIFQYLLHDTFSHSFAASTLQIYQISLLDTDFFLRWIISSTDYSVA